MQNLVRETKERLQAYEVNEDAVLWVGSKDGRYAITWGDFCKQYNDVMYYPGYGPQEIASDLVVVGEDWWLERTEYDGAEGWAFKRKPMKRTGSNTFKIVKSDKGDQTLDEISFNK